jgi:hypothetical protein
VAFMGISGRGLLRESGKRKGADCQQCECPELFHVEMISLSKVFRMEMRGGEMRRGR